MITPQRILEILLDPKHNGNVWCVGGGNLEDDHATKTTSTSTHISFQCIDALEASGRIKIIGEGRYVKPEDLFETKWEALQHTAEMLTKLATLAKADQMENPFV